jgi:hypothetical protein
MFEYYTNAINNCKTQDELKELYIEILLNWKLKSKQKNILQDRYIEKIRLVTC